uniref:Endogenous retrovirus group K member 8 Pol protein-like n=1 Tax=Nicotiana tabacum TaxID=4097 RepID=A0A1S4DQE1_TOBAC|nr:PREDICTED: endogenous retrovirus group K member 8 Pol protein-like [Nicotiana tabacum]
MCFWRGFSAEKQNQFEWTDECQQALKDLKSYLSNPPLLAKPKDGEKLLIYLVVSEVAELSSRLAKWAMVISEYDNIYQPRTAIKSRVLADFVADFSTNLVPEAEKEPQVFTGANLGIWTLFTDGSPNVKGAGLGIVLIPFSGEVIRHATKCYPITNNEAEYETVIAGLELARELGIEQIVIKSDSQFVVNQMQGTYVARETRMQKYLEKYGILLEDKKKSQLLRLKAAWYCLIRENLYRKMFGGPLAQCLGPSQMEYAMKEVHKEHCGNHAGGRSLVKTLIRAEYYWPKMEEEVENFVSGYDKCQWYANNMHLPAELLHSVISPWPFMKWGMNIIGSLARAKGKVRFLLVLTDYFPKWVEACVFKQVREKEVVNFIWQKLICRFGVPNEIVCDNGPQFIGEKVIKLFQSWQIKRITYAPYHPTANGQAESTNKVIINNLKKRLEESKGKWP